MNKLSFNYYFKTLNYESKKHSLFLTTENFIRLSCSNLRAWQKRAWSPSDGNWFTHFIFSLPKSCKKRVYGANFASDRQWYICLIPLRLQVAVIRALLMCQIEKPKMFSHTDDHHLQSTLFFCALQCVSNLHKLT